MKRVFSRPFDTSSHKMRCRPCCLAAAVEVTSRPLATKRLASIDHLVDLGATRGDSTSVGGSEVATVGVEIVSSTIAGETVQTHTGVSTRVLEAEALCGGCEGEHGAEESEDEEGCGSVLHYCGEASERQRGRRRGWLEQWLYVALGTNIMESECEGLRLTGDSIDLWEDLVCKRGLWWLFVLLLRCCW